MPEQITEETTVQVPYTFMEYVADLNSCDSLDMHDPKKSHAKVFTWQGKSWICVGGTIQGPKWLDVKVREVVTLDRYTGPQRDQVMRVPSDFYLGGIFKFNGNLWIMTGNEIILEPDNVFPVGEMVQLSFFQRGDRERTL